MEVDEAMMMLGKWGKWQVMFYIMICITQMIPGAWHMLAIVFMGGVPDHHCKLPENQFPNVSIPRDEEGNLEKCSMYVNISLNNATTECTDGWEYSGDAGITIVSDWDLVCNHNYLSDTSQTVMVIGVMMGAIVFSYVSDTLGRKTAFLFAQWMMVVVGIITVFMDNYYAFCAMRFLAGMAQQGIILPGFILACELFPAKLRTFAGTVIELFWATAMCLLALVGYLIRDWHYLQLFITLPGLLTIPFFWFLPESIPWLCSNDRVEDAEKLLKKAAKFNGVKMPDHILLSAEQESMLGDKEKKKQNGGFLNKLRNLKKKQATSTTEEHTVQYTMLDIFRHPRLRLYAVIMCLLWFVNSLVYYGLSLSTSALAGDRYLNFFLSGLVEIPAYASTVFVLNKWGRRWPLAIFHIVAGAALAVTMFIPDKTGSGVDLSPLKMTFNMIGKFGITGSFGTVFLYAPEIFPTPVRGQAMGMCSVGGRVGNMLAPFSNVVSHIVPWLPGILFGTLSIVVGLLTLLLPETLNRPLPQTIEEIDMWNKAGLGKVPPQDDQVEFKADTLEMGNDVKT